MMSPDGPAASAAPLNLPARRWTGVVAGLLLLAACSTKTDAERLADARKALAAGDRAAATVTLKEALQKNETLAEARALLGIMALDVGDPASAALELRKAMSIGCDPGLCLPPLARAMLASGERSKLTSEFGSTQLKNPQSNADFQTTLAVAWSGEQQPDLAEQALAAALQADPAYVPARLLQARSHLAKQRVDDATAIVTDVLQAQPKSADAWLLKSELQLAGKPDRAAATAGFQKVLELDPRNLPAHVALVTLALDAGDLPLAEQRLGAMAKVRAGHPQTLSLQARVALARGQLPQAREASQQWLKQAPTDPSAYLVSAEIELRSGARTAALAALKKSIGLAPRSMSARLMLGQLLLQDGQPAATLDTLAPLLAMPQPAPDALGQAALAHLQLNQSAAAADLINRGAKAYPRDPRFAAAEAMSQAVRNTTAAGLARLEALAASDTTGLTDVTLAHLKVQRGDATGALKVLARAEQRQPANAQLRVWRGQTHERLNEITKAREAYQQALALDGTNLAATQALNDLDLQADAPRAALERMKALSDKRPGDTSTLLAQADVMRRAGSRPAAIQSVIEEAQRVAPSDPAPARALVLHHLRAGQAQRALSAARSAAEAFKGDADTLEALGQAQLAAGDHRQAVVSFNQALSLRPKHPTTLVMLARALSATGDLDGARDRLQQAIAVAPDLRPAHQGLVELAVGAGRWQQAIELAQGQQRRQPGRPEGWIWEAAAHAGQRHWPQAIEALKLGQAKGGGSDATLKLHAAYLAAGRPADAQRMASEWMALHPKDVSMPLTLADIAARQQQWTAAEGHYRKALELVPDDVPTLNNLAYVLARQGKAGAVEVAMKAVELEPDRGDLLDTLATALVAANQPAKALDAQKRAVEKSPHLGEVRLNLARLALQQGDKPLARQQLEHLAGLKEGFAQQAEVSRLLQSAR